jgi:hypothetical protein
MLQETINNWKIYLNLYDSLENWLNEGERILRRSSEEKVVCISLKSVWFRKIQREKEARNQSLSFLLIGLFR